MAQAKSASGLWSRTLSRARWHVYRSPAAYVVKWAKRRSSLAQVDARRRLAQMLPAGARGEQAAAALGRDGYVFLDDIVDRTELEALCAAGAAKLARADQATERQTNAGKTFWTRLLDEDMLDGTLPTDNAFVRFALQPAVIAVLARALGELPRLDYVLLTLSRSNETNLAHSQLWHRDHDDVRTIKMFVYLTDVTSIADGPFTFIAGPTSDRFGFSLRSHRGDTDILDKLEPDEVRAVLAPRLTTFLVETSRCLHMGSRTAPGHARLLYTATYITIPRLYPEPPPRFRLVGNETEVARAVLLPHVPI